MAVVPLTLTISLCLVFTFVVFFLREHARGRLSSAERDSLLPLAEETPRIARATAHVDAAATSRRSSGRGSLGESGRLPRES
jgi:hypothetical protein